MIEIIDIYNDNAVKIGSADRVDVHKNGLWHKTLHVWLIYKNGEKNIVLMQLRGRNVGTAPHKLDATVAGHYQKGETLVEGLREIKEELGINVSITDLIPLGLRMTTSFDEKKCQTNREFQDLYFIKINKKLDEIFFLPEEVDGLVAIEAKEGIKLFAGELNEITGDAIYTINVEGKDKRIREEINIRKDDIIHVKDNYYYKIFIMAELYLNGWKYISI